MKLIDRELVDGTAVTIGRRVQYRQSDDGRHEKISRTYTAVYLDPDGVRRHESLRTTNRREARIRARAIQERLSDGVETPQPIARISLADLVDRYMQFNEHKGLTPRSLTTYRGEMTKFLEYCNESEMTRAHKFGELEFVR